MQIPASGQQRAGSTRTLLTGADGSLVKRTVLPGGLRVVSEFVPGARSVALGFWVGVGSRDESRKAAGASHFLEHLLFKGTARRGPFEIAAEIEEVGGDLNAFTTKECTCYHARVLADDMPLAVDVLGDMITTARIDPADVDSERGVVIEEIAMNEDDYVDVAHQNLSTRLYGASRLADPVIGTAESLRQITRATVWRHYRRHYRPNDILVAAAGAVDHAHLVREVRRVTGGWVTDPTAAPTPARSLRTSASKHRSAAGCEVISRPTEQAHIMFGVPGYCRTDKRRWPLAVLDVALGTGMSSRLFQEVRENRGLVYSVHSFRSGYSDAGMFGVYAGTMPDKADTTVEVVQAVLADAAANGISDEEVARAKGQLRGASVLESEDAGSRMSRLGEAEVLSGQLLSLDDVVEEIDKVTEEDVATVAQELLSQPQTLTVVGPYEADRVFPRGANG